MLSKLLNVKTVGVPPHNEYMPIETIIEKQGSKAHKNFIYVAKYGFEYNPTGVTVDPYFNSTNIVLPYSNLILRKVMSTFDGFYSSIPAYMSVNHRLFLGAGQQIADLTANTFGAPTPPGVTKSTIQGVSLMFGNDPSTNGISNGQTRVIETPAFKFRGGQQGGDFNFGVQPVNRPTFNIGDVLTYQLTLEFEVIAET